MLRKQCPPFAGTVARTPSLPRPQVSTGAGEGCRDAFGNRALSETSAENIEGPRSATPFSHSRHARLRYSIQRSQSGGVMKLDQALYNANVSLTDLYRVPEIVTRGRFPDGGESDSTWRTQEARHVGSDTIAPGF